MIEAIISNKIAELATNLQPQFGVDSGSSILTARRNLSNRTLIDVPCLNHMEKKRILITGGAGFVGSHLVDRLMHMGHEVFVADNFFTGRRENVAHWIGHPNFNMIR